MKLLVKDLVSMCEKTNVHFVGNRSLSIVVSCMYSLKCEVKQGNTCRPRNVGRALWQMKILSTESL